MLLCGIERPFSNHNNNCEAEVPRKTKEAVLKMLRETATATSAVAQFKVQLVNSFAQATVDFCKSIESTILE